MNQRGKVLLLLGVVVLVMIALVAGGVAYYRHAERLKWAEHRRLRLLESMVHDPQPRIRIKVGEILSRIGDPHVDDIFDLAVKEQNVPLIAGAYDSFADRSDSATGELLIEALQKYGSQEMATALINRGNSKVAQVAGQWAKDRGTRFTISMCHQNRNR